MHPKHDGYPPRADLRAMMAQSPLPNLPPDMVESISLSQEEATKQAQQVIDKFNDSLASNNSMALETCFCSEQAFWKDQLALTYHLRTISGSGRIATSLMETKNLRGLKEGIQIDAPVVLASPSPTLRYIDFSIFFRTNEPAAICAGRILLLPTAKEEGKEITWKIWILSTRIVNFNEFPEQELLLRCPGQLLDSSEIETDVVIIGGGNSAMTLSARLKAFGVRSIMLERNPNPGDNWALRYDCMRFHVPTKFCDLPYLPYDEALRDDFLTREDLSNQVKRYIDTLNLNMINSAQVEQTLYDESSLETWTVKINTPTGRRTISANQLVMATGIGSQRPRMPQIPDRHLYNGISIHSASFVNASVLKEKGVKSVMIVGSANTAFDVLEECVRQGLETTINVRSPTLLIPAWYVTANANNIEIATLDKILTSVPTCVESQLGQKGAAFLASQEPDRYAALRKAGFPVIDAADPEACLTSNLLESAGGHYVDMGGTKALETGEAAVKALTEPVAYTANGLKFSDGSEVNTDAIIWCTGFADKDVNAVAADILSCPSQEETDSSDKDESKVLNAHEIASRMDATWGLDAEGEIRGMWKRHLHLDNFWVTGGFALHHRWHSRTLALQIKASLEGFLPPAYLKTSGVN